MSLDLVPPAADDARLARIHELLDQGYTQNVLILVLME